MYAKYKVGNPRGDTDEPVTRKELDRVVDQVNRALMDLYGRALSTVEGVPTIEAGNLASGVIASSIIPVITSSYIATFTDRLRTSGGSTVILTDDGSNQTLTGSLGEIRIDAASLIRFMDAVVANSTLTVANGVAIGGGLAVGGAAGVVGALNASGNFSTRGTATVSSGLAVGAGITANGSITASGNIVGKQTLAITSGATLGALVVSGTVLAHSTVRVGNAYTLPGTIGTSSQVLSVAASGSSTTLDWTTINGLEGYVSGAPTATGYIGATISGVSYRLLASNLPTIDDESGVPITDEGGTPMEAEGAS